MLTPVPAPALALALVQALDLPLAWALPPALRSPVLLALTLA